MIKQLIVAAMIGLTALVSGCGDSRGYSRGVFHGMMIDKTEREVTSKLG